MVNPTKMLLEEPPSSPMPRSHHTDLILSDRIVMSFSPEQVKISKLDYLSK